MTIWEYRIENFPSGPNEEELNEIGGEGWELIYISPHGTRLVFKRPTK
jgi:hypothetical protein